MSQASAAVPTVIADFVTDDHFGPILEGWLDASDWGRLDSAMTSRASRKGFLQRLNRVALQQPKLLSYCLSHPDALSFLHWTAARNFSELSGQWRLSLASFESLFYSPDTERLLKLFKDLAIVHLGSTVAGLDMSNVLHCDQLEDLWLENVVPLHAPSSSPSSSSTSTNGLYFPRLARCSLRHCPFNAKLVSFLAGLPALVEIRANFRDLAPARFLKKLVRLAVNDENAVSLAHELSLTSAGIREVSIETQRTPPLTLTQLLTNLSQLEIVHWVGCAPPRLADLLTTPALALHLSMLHTLVLRETLLAPAWFEWFYTCSRLSTLELIRVEVVDVLLREPNFVANRFYARLSTLRLVECKANTLLWQHLQLSHFASLQRLVLVACSVAEEDSLRLLEFCHSLESLEMHACCIASWTALARALSCRGETWRDVRLMQLMDANVGPPTERGGRTGTGATSTTISWETLQSLPALTIALPAVRLPWPGSLEAHYVHRLNKWTLCVTHLVLLLPDLRPVLALLMDQLLRGAFPRLRRLTLLLREDSGGVHASRIQLMQLAQCGQVQEVRVQLVWDEAGAQRAIQGEEDAVVRSFSFRRRHTRQA